MLDVVVFFVRFEVVRFVFRSQDVTQCDIHVHIQTVVRLLIRVFTMSLANLVLTVRLFFFLCLPSLSAERSPYFGFGFRSSRTSQSAHIHTHTEQTIKQTMRKEV